jgi:hypothetical protein
LPFGDVLCRITKAAELQRQWPGVSQSHHHNKGIMTSTSNATVTQSAEAMDGVE